ncbi:uncharacterized protein LOC131956015 isoform X2 [Physella acuta]|uniref:uncharacterized protein LOC131956015 isoform X2 n=1 Tax=Physella acuta TaxID=109671 RepID=UPI0027DAD337|nr:uncharacterized protein LOC131956015 isoform X2 [Physella acuta]
MAPNNHFATLGLSVGSDENQIKKAYRTLAKKWHPDKNSDPGAKEKFQEIAASYEFLSSKDRREILERDLKRAATQESAQAQPKQTQFTKAAPKETTSSSATKSKKKTNEASWSETFTKNYRSQQKEKKNPSSGTFSFTESPSSNGSSFFNFDEQPKRPQYKDIYDELFDDFFSPRNFGGSDGLGEKGRKAGHKNATQRKTKHNPDNVAPERGTPVGLDEEYFFSPRYKNQDGHVEKIPCPWCNQLFNRGKLAEHEEKCGKFGLSADEDDSDEDEPINDLAIFTMFSQPQFYSSMPTWQQQQSQLRQEIQRDKLRYREQMASQDTQSRGLIKCPYCERKYNESVVSSHIPWCKEYMSKYGIPTNLRSSHNDLHTDFNDLEKGKVGRRHSDVSFNRERAREYAKQIPKPKGFKDHDYTEDTQGDTEKFPYSRPKMTSGLGVKGQKLKPESK